MASPAGLSASSLRSMAKILTVGATRVLVLDDDGPQLATTQDFLDVIGRLWGESEPTSDVAIPVARLAAEFFDLRTGLAGEALQKFVNYRVRVAVVGDVSGHVATSAALGDFVRESNEGHHVWFVADLDELTVRLRA